VNGQPVDPPISDGYAVLERVWQPGDKIEFVVPLKVQRIKASERIAATAGRVALRCGPLIYTFESLDQKLDNVLSPEADLKPQWQGDLLGGVKVIKGSWADGSPLLGIPYFARHNRSAKRGGEAAPKCARAFGSKTSRATRWIVGANMRNTVCWRVLVVAAWSASCGVFAAEPTATVDQINRGLQRRTSTSVTPTWRRTSCSATGRR